MKGKLAYESMQQLNRKNQKQTVNAKAFKVKLQRA